MDLFFKKILFCSILQHPGYFFEETSLNKFRIPNCPSMLSKKLFHATFLKSYHLLKKKPVLQHFAATSSFSENHPDSIHNDRLPLNTNFGRNCCKTFEDTPFATNDNILQHFAAT